MNSIENILEERLEIGREPVSARMLALECKMSIQEARHALELYLSKHQEAELEASWLSSEWSAESGTLRWVSGLRPSPNASLYGLHCRGSTCSEIVEADLAETARALAKSPSPLLAMAGSSIQPGLHGPDRSFELPDAPAASSFASSPSQSSSLPTVASSPPSVTSSSVGSPPVSKPASNPFDRFTNLRPSVPVQVPKRGAAEAKAKPPPPAKKTQTAAASKPTLDDDMALEHTFSAADLSSSQDSLSDKEPAADYGAYDYGHEVEEAPAQPPPPVEPFPVNPVEPAATAAAKPAAPAVKPAASTAKPAAAATKPKAPTKKELAAAATASASARMLNYFGRK